MGKGYSCSYLVLSPCNCNYIHTVATFTARQGSLQIRKLYQIKIIDTTCVLYTRLSHHACFTCKVNGFVQIRAVHSRAGPTTHR